MISQDFLADPIIMAGVTLFIIAAAVMAVLTVMIRVLALPDAPKFPYLEAISSDRRRIAYEIRRDPARFLTPQGIRAYNRMRLAVWFAAGGWILAVVGIVI